MSPEEKYEAALDRLDQAEALLREAADEQAMGDQQGRNVCRYCEKSWDHHDDCWWLRVRRFMGVTDG